MQLHSSSDLAIICKRSYLHAQNLHMSAPDSNLSIAVDGWLTIDIGLMNRLHNRPSLATVITNTVFCMSVWTYSAQVNCMNGHLLSKVTCLKCMVTSIKSQNTHVFAYISISLIRTATWQCFNPAKEMRTHTWPHYRQVPLYTGLHIPRKVNGCTLHII